MTKDKVFLIAEYFIKKGEEDNKNITPLKMQKLLYYAQAWNLVFNNTGLFDEEFQAWVHGPVIPKVWHAFKDFDFSASHSDILERDFSELDIDEKKLLDEVWKVYGKYDGKYLEILTHREEPWLKAREEVDTQFASNNIISEESMKSYYGRRLKETD